MKTLIRLMAFVSAFALSFAPQTPVLANIVANVTIQQAPSGGMTLARSSTFESGAAAIESYVQVNSNCSNRVTIFSLGGSQSPHTPLLSVYAPSCTGALTIQALIGGTNRVLHSTASLSTGTPEYVAASYDGTTLSLSLNGTVVASQVFTGTLGPVTSPSAVGIGRSYDTFADGFPGTIWSTNIFSSGITIIQVASDKAASPSTPPYASSLPVPIGVSGATVTSPNYSSTSSVGYGVNNLSGQILADSPAAYYRLNETSGTTAYDSSGHGLNATYNTTVKSGGGVVMTPGGGPQLVPTEPDASTFVPDTAGADETLTINIPNSTTYLRPTAAITVEATVQPDAFGDGTSTHYIAFSGDTTVAPYGAWAFGITQGKPFVEISNNSSAPITLSAGTYLPSGKTVHIAFTYDGTTMKLYVNGGLSNSVAMTGAIQGYVSSGAYIGADNFGGEHFGGYVSNVAIYGSALSGSRIAAHADAAKGYSHPQSSDFTTTVPLNTVGPISRMLGWSSWEGPPGGVTMTSTLWTILAKYAQFDDRMPQSLNNSATQYGIAPGFYFDPNQKCTGDASTVCGYADLATAYTESSFAHDCTGNRVYEAYPNDGHNTFTDSRSTQLAVDANTVDVDPAKGNGYLFGLADNFNLRSTQTTHTGAYTSGSATSPQPYCGYSDSSYLAGSRQLINQLDLPMEINGASVSSVASGVASSPNAFAAICESCFSNSTRTKEWTQGSGPLWVDQIDSELLVGKLGKILNIFSHGYAYLQTNDIQGYVLASTLIGWSPNVTISMDGSTPESVAAPFHPGVNLVPLNPVIPLNAVSSSSTLRYGDVYVRAYRDCYLYGKNIGKCVAIVNPDQNDAAKVPTDFTTGYAHAITVDNVNDASCLSDSNACYKNIITELGDTGQLVESSVTPPTTLPASGWEILAQ